MRSSLSQSHAIDLLKAGAAQMILLHHLSAYGPVSQVIETAAPALSSWLYEYARMAVQVFLVVGGFLAARAVSARPQAFERFPARPIVARYLRLVIPYLAALLLAIGAAAFARLWIDDEFVPGAPRLAQLASHVLLLNQWLGDESLSAGVWYIAIDLQLFATFATIVWLGHAARPATAGLRSRATATALSMALVAACAGASLFWFNRDASFDHWAIYFFAAYAMGTAAYWVRFARHPAAWMLAMALLVAFALSVDFRWRLAVALATALILAGAHRFVPAPRPAHRVVGYLSKTSYALFLAHFPVILVVNALFERAAATGAAAGFTAALIAWAGSLALADLLHRRVEARFAGLHRALAS